ncbi:hypothetical protein C5C00_04835 [Rathayibacter rathayi]|uniref:hypothetical protein n=1 Tax=Rathayibacter rathayi TaxID=33887 RepID=UPI000CE785C7|nr:hypothetical protein [Rathayibacter rathayi]PPG87213.1 hypothetical protein C5C47_11335 [Rathayibacter rathayi]PPG98129.1 hypothetical protein C5C00_04835 [Rathayibacter rathayi]
MAEFLFILLVGVTGGETEALAALSGFIASIDENVVELFYGIATVALVSFAALGRGALDEPQQSDEAERRVRRFANAALAAIALTMLMQAVFTIALWRTEPAEVIVSWMGASALIFAALDGAGIALRSDLREQRRRSLSTARKLEKRILRRRACLFRRSAPRRALVVSGMVVGVWWSICIAAVFFALGQHDLLDIGFWVLTVFRVGFILAAAPFASVIVRDRYRATQQKMHASLRRLSRFGAILVPTFFAGYVLWPKNGSASLLENAIVIALAALPLLLLPALASKRREASPWWTPQGAARQAYAAAVGLHRQAVQGELETLERVFSPSGPGRNGHTATG